VVVDQEGARGRVRAMGQPPADAAASPSPRAESTRGGDHARACSRAAVDSLDRRSREAKHSGKGAPMSTEISVRATARTHLGTALARAGGHLAGRSRR
jgi:hypothetical protein